MENDKAMADLLAWVRSVLEQGAKILQDHQARGFHEYSLALDEAAQARVAELISMVRKLGSHGAHAVGDAAVAAEREWCYDMAQMALAAQEVGDFQRRDRLMKELKDGPNVGGEARLAAHQPSQTTTATPQGVASTDQLGGRVRSEKDDAC